MAVRETGVVLDLPLPTAWLLAWHLGALHPVEKGLTLVLAFGPFVVLAVVVAVRRRQEAREAAEAGEQDHER